MSRSPGPTGVVNAEISQPHSPSVQTPSVTKVDLKEEVPPTPQTPQNHHLPPQQQQHTPDMNTPQVLQAHLTEQADHMLCLQGQKTKGALKGWSNLRLGDTPATPSLGTPMGGQVPSQQKSRTVDTSNTFAAFQKAAKEKSERCVLFKKRILAIFIWKYFRERSLREQQESSRRQKERSEKERLRVEQERRKEREEEDALEQVIILVVNYSRLTYSLSTGKASNAGSANRAPASTHSSTSTPCSSHSTTSPATACHCSPSNHQSRLERKNYLLTILTRDNCVSCCCPQWSWQSQDRQGEAEAEGAG